MKTIFTLLFAGLFAAASAADGVLSVTVPSGKNFQVMVDGRMYGSNDPNIVIPNIQAGNHAIRVYRALANAGNGRNNRNSRTELVYSSNVYVKPAYHVDVMVNRFGRALVDEKALNDRNGRWDDDDYNGGYGNGNGGYGNNNGGYNQAMSSAEFDQLLSRVKNQWFGSGKMNTARSALQANYFTTAQVRQLLQQFASDSDKLELAKLAYRNTVDNRSYYQLYDVFSFQESRNELERYLRDFRN